MRLKTVNTGYEAVERPKLPARVENHGKTIQDLAQFHHYMWVLKWDDISAPTLSKRSSTTYDLAVKRGFKGHSGEWAMCIRTGVVPADKVNLVPKKIQLREKSIGT